MTLVQFLAVVAAAAAAFSAAEFVNGPLLFRVLINRRAVSRWLWAGLAPWDEGRRLSWAQRLGLSHLDDELLSIGKTVDDRMPSMGVTSYTQDPLTTLVKLATAERSTALFRLDGDQLAAQINAAAETALDKPQQHRVLLVALAKLGPQETLGTPPKTPPVVPATTPPTTSAATSAGMPTEPPLKQFLNAPAIDATTTDTDKKALITSRHDVSIRIQRRLDDLQITTRSYQAIATLALCIVASVATIMLIDASAMPMSLRLGVVGGLIAPLVGRALRQRAI